MTAVLLVLLATVMLGAGCWCWCSPGRPDVSAPDPGAHPLDHELGRDALWDKRWRTVRATEHATERNVRTVRTPFARTLRDPVPLLDDRADIVLGHGVAWTESAVTPAPRRPGRFTLPAEAVAGHLVVVGDTGSGKSTLLERVATALVAQNPDRLVVHLDAKGSDGSARRGRRWLDRLVADGVDPERVALWPTPDRLNFWSMTGAEMLSSLYAMVAETHPHFDARRETSLRLAVLAPGGPPSDSADLLRRLDPGWLRNTYAGDRAALAAVEAVTTSTRSTAPAVEDALLRYGNLLARLDGALDGTRRLGEFDAVYAVIPGTRSPEVARAQASGMLSMITDALAGANAIGRPVAVLIDEYSAISGARGVGIVAAVERFRSLGGSVIVAAQSWESLADTESERRRLVAGASGGVILLRTSHPDPVVAMVGGTPRVSRSGDLGVYRDQMVPTPVVDPARVRSFTPGDAVHIRHGAARYGRVVPLAAADGSAHGITPALPRSWLKTPQGGPVAYPPLPLRPPSG